MEGRNSGGWDDEEEEEEEQKKAEGKETNEQGGPDDEATGGMNKEGKWESGKGRCAVTGRRVLGGTDGLRRVMA